MADWLSSMDELLVGFYFSVALNGAPQFATGGVDAAFQEISGISKEMNVEEVVSGGEPFFKYRLPTVTTYRNLVLKRGIVSEPSPLTIWCREMLDGGLALPIIPMDIEVKVLNAQGETGLSWNFVKAYPVRWAYSDLKSQDNALLIETLEFAYQFYLSL